MVRMYTHKQKKVLKSCLAGLSLSLLPFIVNGCKSSGNLEIPQEKINNYAFDEFSTKILDNAISVKQVLKNPKTYDNKPVAVQGIPLQKLRGYKNSLVFNLGGVNSYEEIEKKIFESKKNVINQRIHHKKISLEAITSETGGIDIPEGNLDQDRYLTEELTISTEVPSDTQKLITKVKNGEVSTYCIRGTNEGKDNSYLDLPKLNSTIRAPESSINTFCEYVNSGIENGSYSMVIIGTYREEGRFRSYQKLKNQISLEGILLTRNKGINQYPVLLWSPNKNKEKRSKLKLIMDKIEDLEELEEDFGT